MDKVAVHPNTSQHQSDPAAGGPFPVQARLLLLVVDPNAVAADSLAAALKQHGIDAVTVTDPDAGLQHVEALLPDAVLTAARVPPVTGAALVRWLHGRHEIPVLVAAETPDPQLVAARRVVACVPHPCRAEDIVPILHAISPESSLDIQPTIEVGSLCLDPRTQEVHVHGQHVLLAADEFELLHLLMMHAGRVVTPVQLDQLNRTGDRDYTAGVEARIRRLSARLRENGCRSDLIVAVPGLGYRLGFPPL